MVSEFGWVCDKDLASSLITSLGMVGKFFGALIAGWYADKFGRKNCIIGMGASFYCILTTFQESTLAKFSPLFNWRLCLSWLW